MIPTVEWKDGAVRLLDQSRLPEHVEFLDCRDYQTVAAAIRELRVRGAPAIGVTAAMAWPLARKPSRRRITMPSRKRSGRSAIIWPRQDPPPSIYSGPSS